MRYLLLLVLLPLAASQCKQVTTPTFQFGEPFALAPDQTYTSAEGALTVRFDAVSEDSRCPEGVSCVWQGQAVVQLHLESQESQDLQLTWQSGKPGLAEASALGYLFTLQEVNPYPKAEGTIKPGDYRILLKVDKP